MRPLFPAVGEEDLQALVDGELATQRRAAILAHLDASPADQAKVEAWRQQNLLLRAAFAAVAHEPVPLNLSIAPCAKVLAVPPATPPRLTGKSGERRAWLRPWLFLAAGLVLGLGLGLAIGLGLGKAVWRDMQLSGLAIPGLHSLFSPEPIHFVTHPSAEQQAQSAVKAGLAPSERDDGGRLYNAWWRTRSGTGRPC